MFGVIMAGMAARRTRALLTAAAVVLGVAMISGTFVLMDTVMSGYSQIFSTAYVHTDAVVTAQAPFGAIGTAKPIAGASRWALPPLAAAIEKPAEPLTRVAGELARENTTRNPARTATTAAALTVGVALIAFVAVLAQGLRQATSTSIRGQVSAGYVVTAQQDLLPPEVQATLQAAGISSASVRAGTVHVSGANQTMTAVVPAGIAHFYHFTWASGSSPASLTTLGATGVLLASDFAQAHHLRPGARLTVQTTSSTTLHLVVRGIYQSPQLVPLLGALTVTTAVFDRSFTTPGDQEVYVNSTDRAAVTGALAKFTTAKIQTLTGFITSQQASITTLLNLFYVLLALCVLISLFGIINTLALSITERTREIGMLRAIGMTRTQLRRMIHLESQITALIGATVGIAVGLLLAWLTAQALSAWNVGFSLPWATLAILLVAAVLAGTLAGIGPARRASRLDPLTAVSYE